MQPTLVNGIDAIATDANATVVHVGHAINHEMPTTNMANRKLLTTINTETDDATPTSILEFLRQEQQCMDSGNDSDVDVDSIFEEINRLSGDSEERSVDDLLREAELLLSKQEHLVVDCGTNGKLGELLKTISEESTPREMKFGADIDQLDDDVCQINNSRSANKAGSEKFSNTGSLKRSKSKEKISKKLVAPVKWIDKPILSKPNPTRANLNGGNATKSATSTSAKATKCVEKSIASAKNAAPARDKLNERRSSIAAERRESPDFTRRNHEIQLSKSCTDFLSVPAERELPASLTCSAIYGNAFGLDDYDQYQHRPIGGDAAIAATNLDNEDAVTPTNKSSFSLNSHAINNVESPSPTPSITPSNSFSWTRERALEQKIEALQEKLKDTEERLQSLRLQHDTMSQAQRALRDNNHQLQEQSERLKIDVQHLNECANLLRAELQSARKDRAEAMEVQKVLQRELDESREEKRKVSEQSDGKERTIMDLQRQCKEMERIVMRKNPDFMSGLMGSGSRKSATDDKAAAAARRILEQRIAQLEADAKEQDKKAQALLANVQSRFNSVQSKYETHISDLETQVLNLQQINARLNEKIEAQSRMVLMNSSASQRCSSTQTVEVTVAEKESPNTNSVLTQTDFKTLATAKTATSVATKKAKDGAAATSNGKDDAHLMATLRGMRVDLAIKEKAMQRLTRELDECKKTMKKLQKERDAVKSEKSPPGSTVRKVQETSSSDTSSAALKEALNKIKLLEGDYKSLHDKRLQDLKTLQAAHERELSSCHETVRLLEQRLAERDEAFAVIQKRHKVPVDYFALKAKVTSLERRHTEREQRLHMLVEALSKGRLNGALDNFVGDGVS